MGGVARASEHLKGLRTKNDDQKTGVEIVRKALSWPARQIAINAGEDGSVILGKILEKDQYAYGFDSQTGEYGNLVSKGIIDPTKVVRVAIQNAASVAALLITCAYRKSNPAILMVQSAQDRAADDIPVPLNAAMDGGILVQ